MSSPDHRPLVGSPTLSFIWTYPSTHLNSSFRKLPSAMSDIVPKYPPVNRLSIMSTFWPAFKWWARKRESQNVRLHCPAQAPCQKLLLGLQREKNHISYSYLITHISHLITGKDSYLIWQQKQSQKLTGINISVLVRSFPQLVLQEQEMGLLTLGVKIWGAFMRLCY